MYRSGKSSAMTEDYLDHKAITKALRRVARVAFCV
jgi:hypothetical protein